MSAPRALEDTPEEDRSVVDEEAWTAAPVDKGVADSRMVTAADTLTALEETLTQEVVAYSRLHNILSQYLIETPSFSTDIAGHQGSHMDP